MPRLHNRVAHFFLKHLGFFRRSYKERAFGRTFVVPIINGRKTYVSEPWMADIIQVLLELSPGGFIDVGANLGQTLLKVAALDPARSYVGFEPNPACADYTAELIRANGLPYQLIPAGLGAMTRIAQLQMYRNEDTDPSASIVTGFREKRLRTKSVVIVSLEELPAGLIPKPLGIIKIDVEGGEADVLEGLRPLLVSARPFVLIEILPVYNPDNLDRLKSQLQIEGLLKELKYRMFRLKRDRNERLLRIEPIEKIGIHGDLALSDYVMAPLERANDLASSVNARTVEPA